MIVALDQQDVGAEAGGGNGRGGTGWTAADDQHIGLGEDGDLAGGLEMGLGGTPTPLVPRPAAEGLDALLGQHGVAQVALAGGPGSVLEDLRLVEEASAVLGPFVVRHAYFPVALSCDGLGPQH